MSQQPAASALERHLEELIRLNEKLGRLIEARTEAMTSRDVGRLEMLLAQERQVAMAVYEEERKRRVTMLRLGSQFGHSTQQMESVSLSEVADWLGEPGRSALLALRDRLHAVAERIERQNQAALMLAQRYLPYFEELLGVLLDGTVGQASYTPAGQPRRTGQAGMNVLDVRV